MYICKRLAGVCVCVWHRYYTGGEGVGMDGKRLEHLEHRVDELTRQLAQLTSQLVELLPACEPPLARQPVMADRAGVFDMLITQAGGEDKLRAWGADGLYCIGKSSVGASTLEDMRIYPTSSKAAKVDLQRVVFVGGPGPLCVPEHGTISPDHIPEYGRGAIFPYLIKQDIGFFNGQLPVSYDDEALRVLLRGMNASACSIFCFYDFPYNAYLETAVLLWSIGRGDRSIYVVMQSALDATAFPADTEHAYNLPGASYVVLTQRQRQAEVYQILRQTLAAYCRITMEDRVKPEFDNGKPGANTIAETIRSVGRGLLVHRTPLTVNDRQTLARSVFADNAWHSDIAAYLRLIYTLSLYDSIKDESARNRDLFNGLCGEARGFVDGFMAQCMQMSSTMAASVHVAWMQPVVLFLRECLRNYGVVVSGILKRPADA